ncbi:MAG: fibronectin type III domain-containing protein [Vicinamibacterales bacterium]
MRQVRLLTIAAAVTLLASIPLVARQSAPGAPTNLTYVVGPGGALTLQWTNATGAFTHYIIEAAAGPGAPPFLVLPTSVYANPTDVRSKLPEKLSSFSAAGVGAGTYYVRIKAANGALESGPSNEIALPVSAGCRAPGAPTNFTQIVRGNAGWLQWNPGSGGAPTAYIVRASFGPNDPAPPVLLPVSTPYFNLTIPSGSYYVNIVAVNACGQSGPSNELNVVAPFNTPASTPDPAPGQRLPQPYVKETVLALAAQAKGLGYLVPQVACPTRPGGPYADPLEARKVQRNPYIDFIVDGLRQIDQRFGYNAKPTRAFVQAIIAGDEIAYHYGSDTREGSPNVYLVDTLGGHCTGVSGDVDRHSPDYRVFYDEFGLWTSAGRGF